MVQSDVSVRRIFCGANFIRKRYDNARHPSCDTAIKGFMRGIGPASWRRGSARPEGVVVMDYHLPARRGRPRIARGKGRVGARALARSLRRARGCYDGWRRQNCV